MYRLSHLAVRFGTYALALLVGLNVSMAHAEETAEDPDAPCSIPVYELQGQLEDAYHALGDRQKSRELQSR